MPCKFGFIFLILFSRLCFSQEIKPDVPAAGKTSLSGTVIQGDAHLPLKNVEVILVRGLEDTEPADVEPMPTPDRQFSAKSDEKGRFEFTDLLPGTYSLGAARTGMIMKGPRMRQRIVVHLESGKPQSLDLIMLPGAAITGRVLNEDGEPMQHVGVMAMRYAYSIAGRRLTMAAQAESDDKGDYRLFGLHPGSYLVVANPGRAAFMNGSGFATGAISGTNKKANATVYTVKYYPNEISPEQATPVVLKPGDETHADFNLTRVPAHVISGTVTGLSAAKAADKDKGEERACVVMAMREGSFLPVGMAAVGKDSSFKMNDVPSGKYKVVATEYGGDGDNARSGRADAVVDSSDVSGVVVALGSTRGKATGVVRAEDDAKLDYSKLAVVLIPAVITESLFASSDLEGGWNGGYAEIKKDGTFSIEFSPSEKSYRVLLSAHGSGFEDWFTSRVLIGGKDVLDSGFKAAEAQRGTMEIVISNKGATVEGTVLDNQQKPFSNAEIIAMPSDPTLRKRPDLFQNTVADQQGHFKIRGVRPGEYTVIALEDLQSQPFASEPFLKTNSGRIQSLKLESGAKQQVQLQVIPAGQ